MKVVEKFVSINGESRRAGELAVFIRFKGCNLHCCYCDTKWANEKDCEFEELTVEEIELYYFYQCKKCNVNRWRTFITTRNGQSFTSIGTASGN